MHFASLVFGTSIVAVAIALESHRRLHDRSADTHTDLDVDYRTRRHRGRGWTNGLVLLIGFLAFFAGIVGQGIVFIALWSAIPLILLFIVGFAFLDAFRTHRYLHAKLPELEKQSLGNASITPASTTDSP